MTYQIISERKAKYGIRVSSPSDAYEPLKRYQHCSKEHIFCITLNGAHDIISIRIVSIGILNRTIVHPREVFLNAITDQAAGIILAHNHPSGHLEPSSEDYEITKRIKEAGEIIGISLLDHIVFSHTGYYSFLEEGKI